MTEEAKPLGLKERHEALRGEELILSGAGLAFTGLVHRYEATVAILEKELHAVTSKSKMFLLIHEDGNLAYKAEISGEDLVSSDCGYLNIVDVSKRPLMRYTGNGTWALVNE